MKRATVKEILKPNESEGALRNASAVDSIRIELELADVFCKLALESHSPERAQQHRVNARRATDAALHALTKVQMKEKELEGIITKIEEVKALLESLEAGGSSHPTC
jgi:hypothetical protein